MHNGGPKRRRKAKHPRQMPTVRHMSDELDAIRALARRGHHILASLHASCATSDPGALADSLGWSPAYTRQVLRCVQHLHPEKSDADLDETNRLNEVLELSVDMIVNINKRANQLNNHEIHNQQRLAFTRMAAKLNYRELDQHMRAVVQQLNADAAPPQHIRAHVAEKPDIRGNKHIHLTGPAHMIDRITVPIHARAATINKAHPEYTYDRCVGQAIVEKLSDHTGREQATAYPHQKQLCYQPALIITPQDMLDYRPRHIATSDGSTLTPEEYVDELLAPTGWAVIYDEHQEPAKLLRISNERLATDEQRVAMILDNPICAWEGCNRAAITCQAHHLDAHKHGGATSIANMTMVCRYHNRINDDDTTGTHGFLARDPDTGHVAWMPPDPTRPPKFNQHAATSLGGRAYANYRRRRE